MKGRQLMVALSVLTMPVYGWAEKLGGMARVVEAQSSATTIRQQMEWLHQTKKINFVYDSSIPVDAKYEGADLKRLSVKKALRTLFERTEIEYTINANYVILKRKPQQLFTQSRNDSCLSWLVGQYYAVGKQKAGDEIEVQVSSNGFAPVSASTYIPDSIGVQLGDIRLNQKASDGESVVDKLEATFHDEASTQDYYSVGVFVRQKRGVAVGQVVGQDMTLVAWGYVYYMEYKDRYGENTVEWNLDSLTWELSELALVTDGEPLLDKRSKLDDDFGFDDYTYLNNQYIFSDQTIHGQRYTLHLEALENYTYDGYDYYDRYYRGAWDGMFGRTYVVQLCRMTPEYYRFLKSINDAQSNSWSEVGLMQVTPTYSNVKGGFGIVGGYNASSSSKHVTLPSSDGIYTNN